MVCILPFLVLIHQAATLEDLEKLSASSKPGQDWQQNIRVGKQVNDGVARLIESGSLKPEEFERASEITRGGNLEFRVSEMRYELSLAALASGRTDAAKTIAGKWDELMMAMSRPRRIGVFKFDGPVYKVEPTVKSVVAVFKTPDNAQKVAASTADNPEIKQIVDADQADRQGDFAKMTSKQMMAMAERDEKRLKRTMELLKSGAAKTAKDFANAALVLQHGQLFGDYALAHELCVASMILGNKDASWLAGASYDRMLSHSGHPQRFATQYKMGANGYELDWYDPDRINDDIRKAVVHVTLEQAKNRKWD